MKHTTVQTDKQTGDDDTVNIATVISDTLKYTKGELRAIQKQYPEFTDDRVYAPDITYAISESKDHTHHRDIIGCEVCQDGYYALYAYFLKPRNGGEKYAQQRKTLVEIYRDINEIFGTLKHGGTYFGHQYTRILGYAEYSVYLYNYDVENDELKNYDVSAQKKLYITLLKKHIADEINNDPETDLSKKDKFKKQLFETVNHIDRLITEYFYLQRAQEFQYSNY